MNGSLTLKSVVNQTRSLLPRSLPSILQIRLFDTIGAGRPLESPLTSLRCGALMQSLTSSKSLREGRQAHAYMISSGLLLDNTYLKTKLSAFYAICGSMAESRVLFDGVVLKSSFLWNSIIRGYTSCGLFLTALAIYREMFGFGKRADNFTYPFVLKACGDSLLVEIGRKVHCEVIICGYESDVYVANSLLSMYSKFGDMPIAQKLFDKMLTRDLTSWNTLVSGYTKNGEPERALSVFAFMVEVGVRLDYATLLCVLPACADLMALMQGKEIHGYAVRKFMELDASVTNALINVYTNSKFVVGARRLFEKVRNRDLVTWNSIILGYAWHADAVESFRLFHQMTSESVRPDQFTIISLLKACDRMPALQAGRSLHACLTKKGYGEGVIVGTALINMYAKCGSLSCSRQVFDELSEKNLVCWSAMVSGYGLHGRGRDAMALFHEMKAKSVRADKVTLTSVLSACSHSGLIDEGKEIFYQMSNEYSIKPTTEHYSCMVDLLGRAGRLNEAHEFIKKVVVEPSVDAWTALLSACRVHHNVELAEIAAQEVFNRTKLH